MLESPCCLLLVCLWFCQSDAFAAGSDDAQARSPAGDDRQVRRHYLNTSKYLFSGYEVVLEASPSQIMRLSAWLDEIVRVPFGRETLEAIIDSGNQLTIRHSPWALHASGRTLAPVSRNLMNGHGEDVEILFDARIPEHGSHAVFDAAHNAIEFTAVQNLFHELVHARHLANGTWRYFDSEGQAIEEENLFRQQLGAYQNEGKAPLRAAVDGQQIWWPDP